MVRPNDAAKDTFQMQHVLDLGLAPYATADLHAILEDTGDAPTAFFEYATVLEEGAKRARAIASFLGKTTNADYVDFVPAEDGDVLYLVQGAQGTQRDFERTLAYFQDQGFLADPD